MTANILLLLELLLCLFFTLYALYFLYFSIMSKRKITLPVNHNNKAHKFTVIFPAYGEDNVILNSVEKFIRQDYPSDLYQTIVVSDHMKDETNNRLRQMPITLAIAHYENSTKAKALNLAMDFVDADTDYIVILDADNIVDHSFLTAANEHLNEETKAVQMHRTAKKISTAIANYDAISEEINNSIFSIGHIASGLPSRLIGSGMMFDATWFKKNVHHLNTAGEDKELEIMLLKDKIFTYYIETIDVLDEKISSANGYFKQRQRWIGTQTHSLKSLFASTSIFANGNIDYAVIDKLFQFLMVPRLIMFGTPAVLFIIDLIFRANHFMTWWWGTITMSFIASCIISLPESISFTDLMRSAIQLPKLFILTIINFIKPKGNKSNFIHTKH